MKTISIQVPDELHAGLVAYARSEQRSVASQLRVLIAWAVADVDRRKYVKAFPLVYAEGEAAEHIHTQKKEL
jgi:hypothetical protein